MTLGSRDFLLIFYVISSKLFGDCWSSAFSVSENIIPVNMKNDWNEPPCPFKCTCQFDLLGSVLKIDCLYRTDDNSSMLADEINHLLAPISLNLTYLEVCHSHLTGVPTSVCQLEHLSKLTLDNNNIATLPEQCFTKMVNLIEFSAKFNNLSAIQDGVFRGLNSLQKLDLSHNKISQVGLNTFSGKDGLTGLNSVNLEVNDLTELDPWPFILGQLVPGCVVSLNNNQIKVFTNNLKWSYRCGMKPDVKVTLNLQRNNIEHLTDLTNGWNITGLLNLLCLFGNKPISDLNLRFDRNPYVCDCLDYVICSIVYTYQHVNVLNGIFCEAPLSLANKLVTTVPLDQLVCDVPSPPCPQNCSCIKRPSDRTFIVTCRNLKSLPAIMPDTSNPPPYKAKYVLQFNGSQIGVVDYRDYFSNTLSLNVSYSSVTHITNDAWRALADLSDVDLSFNQLTVFPKILESENLTFQSVSLFNNPWRCECEDRWVRNWLASLGSRLRNGESVLCYSPDNVHGMSIRSVSDEQFCYDPIHEKLMVILKIVLPAVLGSIVLVLMTTVTVYRWRVQAFVHFKLHPFDVDECENEEMTYDVFLSCAYEDRDIGRQIVRRLEREENNGFESVDGKLLPKDGYRVCYHERDFTPGILITENIQRSIERSKRVVCLMSPRFLQSSLCMIEFRGAWSHHSQIKKRRLLVVKWPEVDCTSVPHTDMIANDSETVEMDLRLFIATHTYIDYKAEDWWQQFVYSLPIHSLPKYVRCNSTESEAGDELIEGQSTEYLLSE